MAILLADFFNLPVAVLHADYQITKGRQFLNIFNGWLCC